MITANAAWNIWNFRRPIVQSLLQAGHRVTVLAPADDMLTDLQRIGCAVVPLKMDVRGLNPVADLALVRRFRAIFREQRPDVVLSFTIKNNVFGGLAARLTGMPFVPNVTGLGTAFLSGWLLQWIAEALYRMAFRGLPVVFFENDDDRALFEARGMLRPGQAQVLPGTGIDLAHYGAVPMPGHAPEAPVFLMVARLLRDKGVIEFVEAARRIKAEYPQARFQLLGPAGVQNRTAIHLDEVQRWVDDGIIDYLGTRTDVRPLLQAADCVVLPSYREGAPRTLIEASAMARPVIATDVAGCRAVVDADITGFMCQPRDAESLAAAMRRFLHLSPEARAEMGAAARRKMEREFDERIVIAAYHDAVRAVTARG
ncbi:MAG: glycosyltransferase family 4 protein [Rhodobacteraceae bacterium]|nr:glycosyltransferase family 4 protein [Paracoccaceae bacterium]MCZ8082675.1 glycosyltransferase family 4 protein [Paracoccaceae bacterium]